MNARLCERIFRLKPDAGQANLAGWNLRELASFGWTLAGRVVRGFGIKVRLKAAPGLVLCERGVRLSHPWHITAGRGLSLEEGCEIVGISRRGIVFGDRCTVGRGAIIRPTNVLLGEPGEGLRMGNHSNIGPNAFIGCSGFVDIGDRVLMGPDVKLLAENHRMDRTDIPIKDQGVERSFIRIEDDCWLGAGSILLAGVTVGRGAVVAAGAVVTKDVQAWAVVGGVPARLIRFRERIAASAVTAVQ